MLITQNLSIGYGKKLLQTRLNLRLRKGELVCLIGQNGCGKSTLIRTLAALQPALKGAILAKNRDIFSLPPRERAKLLSVVLTDKPDTGKMRVHDLVALGRQPYSGWFGKLTPEDERVIGEAIAAVNLGEKAQTPVSQLSDGEKQRTMIAKALAQDTPIVILDEPTSHLDVLNRVEIILLLRRLAKETGKAVLLSTHELELALQAADKLWLMDKLGIECATPDDFIQSGRLEAAFNHPLFRFDAETRRFKLNVEP